MYNKQSVYVEYNILHKSQFCFFLPILPSIAVDTTYYDLLLYLMIWFPCRLILWKINYCIESDVWTIRRAHIGMNIWKYIYLCPVRSSSVGTKVSKTVHRHSAICINTTEVFVTYCQKQHANYTPNNMRDAF